MIAPAARRDLYGGGVVMLIGAVAIAEALHHRLGTLLQMQAGYLPLVLGILLVGLGLAIALPGLRDSGLRVSGGSEGAEAIQPPDWRGFVAIVAGVASFIGVGALLGLAPAAGTCVFIAALGDRMMTWRSALVLAVAMMVVAVVVFAWLLQVQFPVLTWPSD